MANFEIPDLDAIASVDGAADLLAIYDDSANSLKRTTRNTLLDLSSAPVGLTDIQTLTNKTFTQPVISVDDDEFTLQDNADTSKKVRFQLSGITTSTTRTLTIPDVTDTITTLTATQTLINKTFTSPTINNANISNPTMTVDALSEHTSDNGISVDGLNIKDGKLNTDDSVVAENITDSAVQPSKLQSGTGSSWVWQSWSPTWSGLTVGNGTVFSKFIQVGKTAHIKLGVTFGTTTSVTGEPFFTLPFDVASDMATIGGAFVLALAGLRDANGSLWTGSVGIAPGEADRLRIRFHEVSSSMVRIRPINSTTPFTWTEDDNIYVSCQYEIA